MNPVTSENMSVTGISEPGSIVKVVLPNGSELTGVANNQGEYTYIHPDYSLHQLIQNH